MPKGPNLKEKPVLVVASSKVGGKILTFLEERYAAGNTTWVENLDDAMRVLLNHRGITMACFSEDLRKSKRGGLPYPHALVQMLLEKRRTSQPLLLFWFNPRKGGKLCRVKLS